MIIAINTISFLNAEKEENFIYETFNRITKAHPGHTFIFIAEKTSGSLIISEKVIPVNVGGAPKNLIRAIVWFHLKIWKVLKQYKVDLFISKGVCLLGSKTRQLLIAPDLSFIHQPAFVNRTRKLVLKKFTLRFLNKAGFIIVSSEFEKTGIVNNYQIPTDKIQVIYEGVNENIQPINIEERAIIKEKYAEGNEYFIYSGSISSQKNLLNLLKAFSVFKKRQRSGMQLILAGNQGKYYDKFVESLKHYKFKKEVKLFPGLLQTGIEKIIAASYAMLCPAVYETSPRAPFIAMKCEVPVIVSSTGALPEACIDAALYFDAGNFKDIAEKMMEIFKDEKLRKELMEKGKEQIKKFNWDRSAEIVWKNIEECVFKEA